MISVVSGELISINWMFCCGDRVIVKCLQCGKSFKCRDSLRSDATKSCLAFLFSRFIRPKKNKRRRLERRRNNNKPTALALLERFRRIKIFSFGGTKTSFEVKAKEITMRIFFVTKLSISYDRALLFLVVSLWLRFIAKLKLECNLFFQGR